MTTQQRSPSRALAAAAFVVLAMTVSACSGGAGDTGGTAMPQSASAADEGGARGMGAVTDSDGSSGGGDTGVNRTVVQLRSVIKTGEVAVTSRDLDGARAELDDVLAALDGVIDSESTRHDRKGRIKRSTIVVRVPVGRFDVAMAALEGLGRAQHSDTASKDVTTEVIDVDERVETLENSLDRLQGYQARARDIDDLIRYEQEITRREAELQSLKSQQAYLADQTSMSTITLRLSAPEERVVPPGALEDAGFLAGLRGGWDALTGTVVVVLTVVGAVLPFALVVCLLGIPLWLLVRRAHRGRQAAPAPTPAGSAD